MSARRDNRVVAVQGIYMWSINTPADLDAEMRRFLEDQEHPRDYYVFAEELIRGTLERVDELDAVVRKYAQNWDFSRIAKIDLAILRLAIFEMTYRHDIPPIVSINEAIDLSKVFSIPDSKRFINGILDKYKLELQRPLRDAAGE